MVTKRTATRREKPQQTRAGRISPGPRREDYPNVWEWMLAFSESIPDESWEGVPTDAAAHFDHYVDGVPNQYPS
jgi:hypothetical protein